MSKDLKKKTPIPTIVIGYCHLLKCFNCLDVRAAPVGAARSGSGSTLFDISLARHNYVTEYCEQTKLAVTSFSCSACWRFEAQVYQYRQDNITNIFHLGDKPTISYLTKAQWLHLFYLASDFGLHVYLVLLDFSLTVKTAT